MNQACEVVVIGAGPAGASAAIELARRGHSVAVIERELFPRHKVCGEFLSPEAFPHLERWGLLSRLEAAGAETVRRGGFYFDEGRSAQFELPRPALGVSRYLLDDLLARRAEQAGARILFGATAEQVGPGSAVPGRGFAVSGSAGGSRFSLSARAVVAAWGRWSPLDRTLRRPFASRTSGRFFGWSRHYEGDSGHLAQRVELHFFRGGYAGLSRVEKGIVNFAGVVSERELRRSGAGWEIFTERLLGRSEALAEALRGLRPAGEFRGSPTVFFEKRAPVFRGLIGAGDAAGVRDPFTGSGQSTAIANGILAAEAVSAFLEGRVGFERMCRNYAADWRRLLGGRFLWDAVFRAVLFSPSLRRLLLPRLAKLIPRGFELTRPLPRSPAVESP